MKHRRVTPSKQAYMILDFLNGLEEPIDCNDIAKYLKLQRGHTRKNLVRLEELGMVKKGFKITAKGIKTLRSKENE